MGNGSTALIPITSLQYYPVVLSLTVPHQFWSNLQAQHPNIFVTVAETYTKDSRAPDLEVNVSVYESD